jgi:hypothetical protein
MRRAMVAVGFVVLLFALDATFNDYRFSGAIYREIAEFGRVVNRVVSQGF